MFCAVRHGGTPRVAHPECVQLPRSTLGGLSLDPMDPQLQPDLSLKATTEGAHRFLWGPVGVPPTYFPDPLRAKFAPCTQAVQARANLG